MAFSPDLGRNQRQGPLPTEPPIATGDNLTQTDVVVFDTRRDNVGTPDYGVLVYNSVMLGRARAKYDPESADYYIDEGDLDYPPGFVGPEPFKIKGKEEWDTYQGRVRAIEDRWAKKEKDELTGDTV